MAAGVIALPVGAFGSRTSRSTAMTTATAGGGGGMESEFLAVVAYLDREAREPKLHVTIAATFAFCG